MESKERRNSVGRAILLWLYEQDESYPLVEDFLTSSWFEVGGEDVGNDELVRTVRWLHDRGLVAGPEIDQVPYPVKLILTAAGRLIVTEQDGWVEPEAATPAGGGPNSSVHVLARAFLLWLHGVNHQQPTPQTFLDNSRAAIAGHQIDNDELFEAVRLLVAKGLVKGPTTWGGDIPLRVRLTDAGLICVVDHDGNVGRQATWNDVERAGGTTVDKTITTTGNGNTVVGHSDNVNVAPDPAGRPDFIVDHATDGTEFGHAIEVTMTGGPQQLHAGIGVAVLDPQEGVTATVANGGTRRIVRDFRRQVIVTLDPPVGDSDITVEVIVTCEDVDPPHGRWTLRRALTISRGPWAY